MYRFDSKKGYYFFPKKNDESDETLKLLRGADINGVEKSEERNKEDNISIKKLGLQIPQDTETYEEFEIQMEKSEEEFINRI